MSAALKTYLRIVADSFQFLPLSNAADLHALMLQYLFSLFLR